jgi:methylenetetrahydrofolate dehydrogenase (NADP+)/methenyltetrahydrofolate cyclohydrolase
MILDGKKLRDELLISYKEKISKDNLSITLAIILVGDDEASKLYIKNKEKYCSMVGINVIKYLLPKETSEEELISLIKSLNEKEEVTGIILQSPVPDGIDFDKCSGMILPSKDVDGFTKDNVYNLYLSIFKVNFL